MEWKNSFKKVVRLINPKIPIGGLEITDAFLRFLVFRGGVSQAVFSKIPPGVLEDGKVLDVKAFLAALIDLRSKVNFGSEPQNVVVSLSASFIYTQVFSLPNLPEYKMDEAVNLNLKMISPIPIEAAYFDSQYLGVGASREKEFLGAFAERALVDPILSTLKEAGFSPVAVEFSALSISRVLKDLGSSYDFSEPFLVINFLEHGVDFMIMGGGGLYFRYFSNFQGALSKREIDFASFEFLMKREAARVLNFYTSRKANAIGSAIIVGPQLAGETRAILESFFGLQVYDFEISKFRELPAQWMASLGAVLRGELGRSEDVFISLAPVGTEVEFKRERLLHFVVFWRNILLAVFGFLFFIFLIADSSLARLQAVADKESQINVLDEQIQEFDELRLRAIDFNRKVSLALNAKEKSIKWSPILDDIKKAAGASISLKRVYINFDQGNGLIVGKATGELSAINFKNLIANNTRFTLVSLPFANIVPESDGKVSFQLTFGLK